MEQYKIEYIMRELEDAQYDDVNQIHTEILGLRAIQKAFKVWDTMKLSKHKKADTLYREFGDIIYQEIKGTRLDKTDANTAYARIEAFIKGIQIRATAPDLRLKECCKYYDVMIYADTIEQLREKTTGEAGEKQINEILEEKIRKITEKTPTQITAEMIEITEILEKYYATIPNGETKEFIKKELRRI